MDFGAFLPHKSNEKLSAFNFETVKTKSGIRLQCDVAGGNLPPKLYYDVSINSNDISLLENANWAAIALLYPAMLMKADLEIDFAVSPRLLDALKFDVQRLLMGRDDRLGMVRVNAYDGSSNPVTRQDRGVGTGFSGGVDSFATLTRYSADFVAESLKTTHLATFHNIAPDATPVFDFLKKRTEDFGAAKGLQTMGVFSNIDTFLRLTTTLAKQRCSSIPTRCATLHRHLFCLIILIVTFIHLPLTIHRYAPRPVGILGTWTPSYCHC